MVVMGAAMLWVGWFGFNAGSALSADRALPALKPNQPTHNIAAPITTIDLLCGMIDCVLNSLL